MVCSPYAYKIHRPRILPFLLSFFQLLQHMISVCEDFIYSPIAPYVAQCKLGPFIIGVGRDQSRSSKLIEEPPVFCCSVAYDFRCVGGSSGWVDHRPNLLWSQSEDGGWRVRGGGLQLVFCRRVSVGEEPAYPNAECLDLVFILDVGICDGRIDPFRRWYALRGIGCVWSIVSHWKRMVYEANAYRRESQI